MGTAPGKHPTTSTHSPLGTGISLILQPPETPKAPCGSLRPPKTHITDPKAAQSRKRGCCGDKEWERDTFQPGPIWELSINASPLLLPTPHPRGREGFKPTRAAGRAWSRTGGSLWDAKRKSSTVGTRGRRSLPGAAASHTRLKFQRNLLNKPTPSATARHPRMFLHYHHAREAGGGGSSPLCLAPKSGLPPRFWGAGRGPQDFTVQGFPLRVERIFTAAGWFSRPPEPEVLVLFSLSSIQNRAKKRRKKKKIK